MIGRTLMRIIAVTFSAALGALASLFVMVTLGLERFTHATYGQAFEEKTLSAIVDWLQTGFAALTPVALLPALALVLIGEVARIRSWLYYLVGGGAALAVIPLLSAINGGVTGGLNAAVSTAALWQVLATAGFAGGFVYWLLAGRNA
jgi:hypothetical protein